MAASSPDSCRMARPRFAGAEALAHEAHDLAVGTAAGALVLVDVDVVEEVADDLGLAEDVLVAPVAGRGVDDLAAAMRHLLDGLAQGEQGRGVVAVVEDDGGALVGEHVEAAGNGGEIAREGLDAGADGLDREAERVPGGHRREQVLDLEADAAAVGQRQVGQARHRALVLAGAQDDGAATHGDRLAARAAVRDAAPARRDCG